MESKHTYTPGPWGISEGYDGQAVVGRFDDDEYGPAVDVCGVYTTEDDAILIAAAPDMYEAIGYAMEILRDSWGDEQLAAGDDQVYNVLAHALARAEGRC
jgi:hypothetical protein